MSPLPSTQSIFHLIIISRFSSRFRDLSERRLGSIRFGDESWVVPSCFEGSVKSSSPSSATARRIRWPLLRVLLSRLLLLPGFRQQVRLGCLHEWGLRPFPGSAPCPPWCSPHKTAQALPWSSPFSFSFFFFLFFYFTNCNACCFLRMRMFLY